MDKYQEALKRAKTIYRAYDCCNADLEYIFPELKESRDEQIREDMIKTIKDEAREFPASVIASKANSWITWLEKQRPVNQTMLEKDKIDSGFTKMMEKSEFKFKEGDWLISKEDGRLRHILEVSPGGYTSDQGWLSKDTYESMFRLWTIQDAKSGDVLSWDNERYTIILKELKDDKIIAWCSYNSHSDHFGKSDNYDTIFDTNLRFQPATEMAKKKLFEKIKESGYVWNKSTLELIKIPAELTEFESAMFSTFSDIWQDYMLGRDINIKEDVKEHSEELLEIAKRQSEWDKEDESTLKGILDCYKSMDPKWRNWLKSLKPQNHWKPTDKQLQALSRSMCGTNDPLYSLYEDLKKL